MTPVWTGQVKQGKLILDQRDRYLFYLAGMEGKPVDLILRQRRKDRSGNQNRYYWGVIVDMLANHLGYDKESMHEALKSKFASSPHPEHEGLLIIESTAGMNTARFLEYCEQIKSWAALYLNLYIPDPETVADSCGRAYA